MSFGTGSPWWNKRQELRSREQAPHGRAEWNREQSWGVPYATADILKDGELFDFNGRFHSSEGTFPKKAVARFYDEDDGTYPAKEGYSRALSMIDGDSELYYESWTFDDPGAVEFWVRPYFNYNSTANNYTFISDWDATDASATFAILYDISDDKIKMNITGTAGTATVDTSAYTSNADLQTWIHIKATWDSANDNYKLLVDGAVSDSSSADVGTWTPKDQLNVGCESKSTGVANIGESLFCDMRWISNWSASAAHYAKDKPWFNPEELASKLTTVMIAPHGLTVNKGDITIFDQNNRQILLGSQGIRMTDKNLSIIHDVADCVVASYMVYAGHLYMKLHTTGFTEITISYDNSDTDKAGFGTTTNSDLGAFLPDDISNPRAVLALIRHRTNLDANKVLAATHVISYLEQSQTYDTDPDGYGMLSQRRYEARVAALSVADYVSSNVVIPITWNNGRPYITTRGYASFVDMDSNSGTYEVAWFISIAGFFV